MARTKAEIGDISEIKTPRGLAYVQYTHDSKDMGQLVRVLPGLFNTRPTDFAELAKQNELYFVFYTLNYALLDQQAEVVSHQPLPEWAQSYPLMRWCGARDLSGKAISWKIFSASSSLTVDEHQRTPIIRNLTPEQQKLSIRELWPHPVMVKKLTRSWTPERAEEIRLQDAAKGEQGTVSSIPEKRVSEPMKHYLYFPKKQSAEEVGRRLRGQGFSVQVGMGAGGKDWLTLAKKAPPKTAEQMDELRDEMQALAEQFDGEYDGWEAAVDSLGISSPEHGQKIN